jgi:hypothetical protein
MSFGAPPSKAAQEQEAAARNAAIEAAGGADNQNEGNVEVVGEDTAPAPVTSQTPAPEPQADEPPTREEPTAPPNPRDEIARRYRERREAEESKYNGRHAEPVPAFVNAQNNQAEEAPAEAAPPAEAKTYEVKVFGKSENVTREKLLAMADMTAEDAADLPEKTLIKAAQITEAAKRRHENSKLQPFQGATPAPAAPPAKPAENMEPNTGQDSQEPTSGKPTLKEALEKIQYGDPEEAEAAFVSAVDQSVKTALQATQHDARVQAIKNENEHAIVAFSNENPDITGDPHASRFLLAETTSEIINDLRALGAPEANLAPLYLNPSQAIQAHREARLQGYNVRKPTDILASAGNTVRGQFGLNKETQGQTQPAPAVPPTNRRVEAKRGLIQQPQRSGNPVPAAQPVPQQTRSQAIQRMRAARGQSVV